MRVGKGFTTKIQDSYDTPLIAWELILSKMKKKPTNIWCPFYNKSSNGHLKKMLKNININVIHKDKDFFTYEPKIWDVCIDNPSYSNKEAIIKRCKALNKPFALLLPIDTLERLYLQELFKDDKLFQIIIPNKRYNFNGYDQKNTVPFKSCWFTYKMELISNNQLVFE
jgi:hypothetical protein